MDNNDLLYQLYLQEMQKRNNPLSTVNSYANTLGKWGNNLSGIGNVLSDTNNGFAQSLGSKMSSAGDALNSVSNKMNPSNYFRGQAPRPYENNPAMSAAIDKALGISDLSSLNMSPTLANAGTTATTLSNFGAGSAPTIANGIGANTISNLGANGLADGLGTIGSSVAAEAGGLGATGATGLGTIGGNIAATAGADTAAGAGAGLASGAASGGTAAGTTGATSAGLGATAAPVAALATLAVMGLQGANRKRAKQGGEALMKATNNTVNQQADTALDQTQQNAQNLQMQAQQALNNNLTNNPVNTEGVLGTKPNLYGEISTPVQNNTISNPNYTGSVGFASNTQQPQIPLQLVEQNANNDGVHNLPTGTMPTPTTVQQGAVSEQAKPTDNRGLIDKLVNGLTDFSRGFNENYNNGFEPDNLTNNQFTTDKVKSTEYKAKTDSPVYQQYINSLKNAKDANGKPKYSQDVINAVSVGHNGGNKDVANWVNQNLNNANVYEPVHTYETVDKNKMGRTGELVGSMARWAKNPNVQALLAGGLSAAMTGNPLYGLGQAYKYGNARAMSNVYRDVLKQYGVETPDVGILGNITSNDMNNIGKMQENRVWHQYLNQRYNAELERKTAADKEKQRHNKAQEGINQQNANSRSTSAEASKIRAVKYGTGKGGKKGGSGSKYVKPQNRPGWNKDLADYQSLKNNYKAATKMPTFKNMFINKYGVDPDKYLK